MKRSNNSSSAPKPDPSADKSPSMEDDESSSGSQQKPEPDVEVVPKDTNRDPFPETKTIEQIKPPKTYAERAAFIEERNRMRRYNSPAARTNYSVKREEYDLRTLRTMSSSSARYQQQRASAIIDAPPSPDSSENELEEEDLKLGKRLLIVDDSMENEKVSKDGEKQRLRFEQEDLGGLYKAFSPSLNKLLEDYFDSQVKDEVYERMMAKASELHLCDNWSPIQKLIEPLAFEDAMNAQIQEKLESLSSDHFKPDGEPSSKFVECLLKSIFCSGPDMSDVFVLCADVFFELYLPMYDPHQVAGRSDAGDLFASSSSSSAAVKENSYNQEMATSSTEKLTNKSRIVHVPWLTPGVKFLEYGCVSIAELISRKIIFSHDVSDQDIQTMTDKCKTLAGSEFEDIFKMKFLSKVENIDQVIQEVKDLLGGKSSFSEDSASVVAKALLQCTFCMGAKPTDNFIFCEDLYYPATHSEEFYCSKVEYAMNWRTNLGEFYTPTSSTRREPKLLPTTYTETLTTSTETGTSEPKTIKDASKKRQHSPTSNSGDLDNIPPAKK